MRISKTGSGPQFAWGALRGLVILSLAIVFRQQIIDASLLVFGGLRTTLLAIDVLSTPLSRLIFAVSMIVLLMCCAVATRGLSLRASYLGVCLLGFLLIVGSIHFSGKSFLFALPGLLLLSSNLLPSNVRSDLPPLSESRVVLLCGVLVSEGLLFWRHVRWVAWLWTGRPLTIENRRWLWALPGVVLASVATAALIGGGRLVPIEQTLRWPATVKKVAVGDYNWIKVDKSHKALFAVGHGFEHIHRFDVSDWSMPPVVSATAVGFPQSFEYSASNDELYVYDDEAKRLRTFDAENLALKSSYDIGQVSPGDTWLSADDHTNTVLVVSEADEEVGNPLVLVDRSTGKVLDGRDEAAGNLTLDPTRSLGYLSFFRRQSRVSIYDLEKREIVKSAPIGPHAERMALLKNRNELLVTLPPRSRVARVDAGTLDLKGYISADFGVRAIAVDPLANLLLTGSIATGRVNITDLSTMTRRASFYLGPWLRTIELVPETGMAYVSSNGAIYEVRYK